MPLEVLTAYRILFHDPLCSAAYFWLRTDRSGQVFVRVDYCTDMDIADDRLTLVVVAARKRTMCRAKLVGTLLVIARADRMDCHDAPTRALGGKWWVAPELVEVAACKAASVAYLALLHPIDRGYFHLSVLPHSNLLRLLHWASSS